MSKLPAWAHEELRDMARQSGVVEYGGRAAGWQGQVVPRGFKSQAQMNAEGCGRTVWIGQPEWCSGLGMTRAQIMRTVEKAIAGRRLGKRQALLIESMLTELAALHAVDECSMTWHTMSDDDKENALDAIFGADTREATPARSSSEGAAQGSADPQAEIKRAEFPRPRPATPAKAPRHFPELDRQPEAATIYDMRKAKAKRSVGRPPLPGRRVVIKLEERQIKAAEKLGGGNLSAGIRKALEAA